MSDVNIYLKIGVDHPYTSQEVQLKWQTITKEIGCQDLKEINTYIQLAEDDDIYEEKDKKWFRPKIVKRMKIAGTWKDTLKFHDPGKDFSSIGIGIRGHIIDYLGVLEWEDPTEDERISRKRMQQALIDHYVWFNRSVMCNNWLRSQKFIIYVLDVK